MKILVFQHVDCEGLGTGAEILEAAGVELEYIHLYAGEVIPADWDKYNGLIVLGGPMNVYQEAEFPFLKAETQVIREAIRLDKPVLGICLGAQLIAKASGAKVYAGSQKEIGWFGIDLTKSAREDKLFAGFPSPLTVFQWHGDTFDLPQGAQLLAGSGLFPHQAFCLNKKIYGLQFHLEVSLDMIENWMDEYREELESVFTAGQIEDLYRDNRGNIENLNQRSGVIFERFLGVLKGD